MGWFSKGSASRSGCVDPRTDQLRGLGTRFGSFCQDDGAIDARACPQVTIDRVAAVLVNWNSAHDVLRTIGAIRTEYSGLTTVVVDNASASDDWSQLERSSCHAVVSRPVAREPWLRRRCQQSTEYRQGPSARVGMAPESRCTAVPRMPGAASRLVGRVCLAWPAATLVERAAQCRRPSVRERSPIRRISSCPRDLSRMLDRPSRCACRDRDRAIGPR